MDPFVLALAIGAFVLGFAAGAFWMWRITNRAIDDYGQRTRQPGSDNE